MLDLTAQGILTVGATILALLWLLWMVKKPKKLLPPLPPGPIGLPFVGYLPFLGADLHLKFDELAGVYGPIYKLWLGSKLCCVISSPSLVKEIVRDQDIIFANRDPTISALAVTYGGIDIAFLPFGQEWRNSRKIFVREVLNNTNITNSCDIQRAEVKKSIRYTYDKTGLPIDVGELSFLTALNSATSLAWGDSLKGDIGSQIRPLISELMVLLGKPNVSDLFPSLAWFDLQGIERKSKKVLLCFDQLFDSIIEKRIKDKTGEVGRRKDFLQTLLELKGNENYSASMTMNHLKALLMDMVSGGIDTTAAAVEWVMAELMQNPDAMRRVQEELEAVVGLDNLVEDSHLSKLHYLDAVIKETLRLHPPVPFLAPRCPSETVTVSGYTIPKGTRLFLNMWTIQRDPQIWENSLEFRPERFLGDHNKFDYSGNDFRYLPFGSGRRICAGIPLAERMLPFILASFLHSFEWRLPSGTELEFSAKFGIVIKKMKPLVAIPTPRLSKMELYS